MTVAVKTLCAQINLLHILLYIMHFTMCNVFNLNLHCISPKDFFVRQLNVFKNYYHTVSYQKNKEK